MTCTSAPQVTVSPRAVNLWTANPQAGGGLLDPQRSNDDLIGYTLISIWSLTTGRVLRDGVPPADLDENELIDFWADPLGETGR